LYLEIAMLLSCPNEILQAIFNHSNKHDLYRLIRVNHLLFDIAICFLYRSIPRMDDQCTADCLISLCFNDFYASLVRDLSIDWSRVTLEDAIPYRIVFKSIFQYGTVRAISQRRILQDRIKLLNTCLRRLHNLTVLNLSFNDIDNRSNACAHRILRGCTFELSRFATSLACKAAVMQFLKAQPGIVALNLSGTFYHGRQIDASEYGGGVLPATALPNLRALGWTLGVPCELVAQLIEGRPVQRVNVMLSAEQAMQAIDLLLLSADPIDSAIFKFCKGVDVKFLPHIAARLPDLRSMMMSLIDLPDPVRVFYSTPNTGLIFDLSANHARNGRLSRPTS
jgi:hypothetical protein